MLAKGNRSTQFTGTCAICLVTDLSAGPAPLFPAISSGALALQVPRETHGLPESSLAPSDNRHIHSSSNTFWSIVRLGN